MNITYTFPADSPTKELAGKTFYGGRLTKYKGRDVVNFDEQKVMAVVAGQPELEVILAAWYTQAKALKKFNAFLANDSQIANTLAYKVAKEQCFAATALVEAADREYAHLKIDLVFNCINWHI